MNIQHHTAQPQTVKRGSPILKWLRSNSKTPVTALLIACFSIWTIQVKGVTLTWDGGANTWDHNSTAWWNSGGVWTNSFNNIALFGGTAGTVTLASPLPSAGGLIFNTTGYTLTGGTLTLGAPAGLSMPTINVAAFSNATIASTIAGTSGLAKTGNGTLFLTNPGANTYTGDTVINGGALVITNQNQLGASMNTISINGAAQTGNPGYSGGQLVVDGSLSGVTMSRNIAISGRGPGAASASGGLVSVGSNTFNGDINLSGPGSAARITATHGNTTLNGTVQLGTGADSLFYGNGNIIINGQVTGFDVVGDRFIKAGNLIGTTLWLTNDNNNFIQPLRVDSGTVRVSTPGALGSNTGLQQMDSNGGFFEILTDVQDWSSINFRKRGNAGGVTVGHGLGSTLVNQTITLGDLLLDSNSTFQVQGRSSGYNTVVTGSANGGTAVDWVNGNPTTLSNNSNGLFTINADIQRRSETTARTLTINGNGDTLLTGNILQLGTGAVSLVKASQSTLTISGTASTATGTTTIQDGTLVISAMGALPSGALLIGNATTTPGALTYVGAGETSGKAITLNTTTANNYINSSGTGALILTGTITALAGAKTLVLGGTSTALNEIRSAIPAAATNVQKIDGGTWVLSGANLYTGTTTISNGTLQIKDTFSGSSRNVIGSTGAIIFNVDTFTQSAGGTFEYLGDGANASAESVGALTITAGANTIKATAGGGGTAALTFASLGVPSAGSGMNFVTNAGGSITLTGAADTNGILNAHLFYNGGDFASGSAVGAATYTTEAAGTSLAGANTLPYLVNTTDIASQSTATINAGIKFNDTRNLTLGAAQTLTIQNGAATVAGGILVTGGTVGTPVSVTISGGNGITSGGTADIVFRTDGEFDTLNLNTPITATTTGGWTKLGKGTLVLGANNANTTGGQVHINEGTVKLGIAGADLGADSMDVRLRQGATLDLNGFNLGTAGSGTGSIDELSGAGILTNTGALASIRIGNGNGGSQFNGSITGLIDLAKNGSGTFRIQGPQTYTGVVTLSAGNLDVTSLSNIGQASGIGTGDDTSDSTNAASLVFNGGSLRYIGQNAGNTFQSTQTPSVSIDRLFTLAANGRIDSFGSYGDNDSGTRVANHAALVFNKTNAVSFSGAGVRTLTLGGDSLGENYIGLALVNNPNANEALSITKVDGGLWILGNAGNIYSGTTLIQGGVLQAQDGASLPTSSNLFLDGGGALFQSSGTFTRALGTGANEVRFRADGNREGFSASTAPLTVTLGTSGLIWGSANSPTAGTTNFLGAGTLYLSSSTALADVNFTNNFEITQGIAATPTVSTTSGSTTVTLTAGTTAGLAVGQAISGTNIPAGAYISSINATNQISINVNATATGTGIAASISGDGFRDIRVDDNTLTGLDFATLSGVISGAGGLGKEGTGLLILGDANTYSGKTVIRDGFLTVTSIGAAGDTSSSLGTNVGGGALEIGRPGSTSTANLLYVGSGETATRQVDLVGTTGTRRIDSSGSGALILANLNNSTATSVDTTGGAKTLELRGQNTDGNMVTSVLANNGGALTISKQDGGVWILNPTGPNTFTGSITAGGGSLGLTANGIGAASRIDLSNASIFAYGGPLATSTLVQLNNNTTGVFAGSNDITINANVQKQAGANDQTISNNLENGAVLTVNGNFVNLETAAATRTISIRGYGSTVWNGVIQNNSGTSLTAWNIAIAPNASFTMTGAANTYTGGTTLTDGILILDKVGALGPSGTFSFNGGTLRTTVAGGLTGANALVNPVTIAASPPIVDGTESIQFNGVTTNSGADRRLENNLSGGATLIFNGTLNLSNDGTSRTFTLQGTGDASINGAVANGSSSTGSGLRMNGTGTLTLLGTSTAGGQLTAERGTTLLSGTSGGSWNSGNVTMNGNGILTLDNSGGENAAGRLRDAGTFTMNGGIFNFIGDGDGTSETTGAMTINSIMGTINMSGAGPNVLTFASVNFANSGSSLDLSGITALGSTNQIIFTTAPTANIINGVLNRVIITGDFATHTANGVEAFSSYNAGNNLNTAANTDTMDLTANAGLSTTRTLNALKINGTGLNIGTGSTAGSVLTLTTSSFLNTGGNNTLSIPFVNIAGSGIVQVDPGTVLTVDSTLIGAGQINKAGTGEVIFTTRQFVSSTINVSGGLMTLSGGDNTLFPGTGQLTLDTGATVDLNGNLQYMGALAGPAGFPGAGGTLKNTGALTTFITNGGGTFGGVIQDAINLGRIGGGTLTLEVPQTYTGGTMLLGGDTTLRDNATLPNTSAAIEINQARLLIRNNDNLQTQVNDRVNDTAPITLRGGTIDVQGRISTAATETMGALTVLEGANTITNATGGGTITSSDLTFASLTRSPGATINFAGSSALGAIGNLPRILFTTPLPTVATGALGAWAIANSTDYAAYNATNGVGVAGTGGFVGYTPDFGSNNITNLDAAGRFGAAQSLTAATTTTGMLRLGGKTINDITFTSGSNILNLELGGLLRENNVFHSSIGTAATRGVLTAGGTEVSGTRELVIYTNTATGTSGATFGGTNTTIGVGATQVTLATILGTGLVPGMQINNANFPAGTTVISVTNNNILTLSAASTNGTSQTSQTFTTGVMNLGSQTTASNIVTMASTVGLAPGMTITGTGIPAGTFVTSVDSLTQLTLSQAATTTVAGTAAYTLGIGNVIVNSVIADNGFGNSVQLVQSGGGVLNLSAPNTYTGGTIVNQGTLNLIGDVSTVVIPAGGLTVTSGTVLMNTNQGQIDPNNMVTLNGSSTVTLVGNNTLTGIAFNNVGGTGNPTFNVGGTLTLASATAVTATSNNAATLPVIAGGTIILPAGANTFSVGAPTLFGDIYTDKRSALNITSIITAPSSTVITKSGTGLLQLSAQSTFVGGINVTGGGLVLGASSTSTFANSLFSGPLGGGPVNMSVGTVLAVDDSSRGVGNAFTFQGNPIFSNVGVTTDTLTVNGALTFNTLATTGLVVNVDTPYLNVVLGGDIQGIGSVTSVGSGAGANTINKTGPGSITGMNFTGIGASVPIDLTNLTNTTFSLLHDGDGTSGFQTINLGTVTWEPVNGILNLTIGRAGAGLYFPTAAFKTIELASLNSSGLPSGLNLTNSNGYGLDVPDNIALATVSANTGPTFSVSTANTSLQIAGLRLSGQLTGGPSVSGDRVLIKAGAGTLVLDDAANTFGGAGAIIDITDGLIQVAADGALGNSGNIVRIGANNLAEGLRVTGSFATSREINLNGASSGIDVTNGNTFTLNSAFTFATATNSLAKNDLGTLVLTQAQPGWDGVMTVNQGVLRITDPGALGSTTGATILSNVGSALELNGMTLAEPLQFATSDDATNNGFNGGGTVRATSGINNLTGTILLNNTAIGTDDRSRAATFTADSGASLEISGVVTANVGGGTGRDVWIGLGGEGTGTLSTAMNLTGTLGTNRYFGINKFGSGTWSITAANAHPGTRVFIKEGTLVLSGNGSLGTPTGGQETTPTIYLNPTGVLTLDNTSTDVDNRLSGRLLNVSGADVNIIGNSAGTAETVGAFTLREGLSIFTLDADAAGQLDFTTGAITRSTGATLLIRGDNFGSAASAGVATFTGSSYAYTGQVGNAGTTNKGILPWALGDTSLAGGGTGFVTSDTAATTGTTILRLLTGSEQTTDFATANANVNLGTTEVLSSLTTINSLRLASGGGVDLNYVPLALDSGGLITLTGNTGIDGFSGVSFLTTTSNRELIIHTVGNLTLNVPIAATTGALTKSGAGELTLTAGNAAHGTVFVNDGTLKLGGGDQTILPGRSLQLNHGGTLDLNGTVQQFNLLESRLTAALAQSDLFPADSGGIVINSDGVNQATLVLATGNVTFTGSIQGNIAVVHSQAAAAFQDWNLYSEQTYSGPSLFNGGRTQFLIEGKLTNTASIMLDNAMLVFSGSNGTTDMQNITNRLGDTIPLTMRGGSFQFNTSAAYYTTETMGAISLAGGQNVISMGEGGTRINEWDLTADSFSRAVGSRSTVRFYGIDATPNDDSRLFLNNLNGVATTNVGDGLTNNLIGGWAVFEREFASYIPGQGVGGLNTQGFAGYSPNLINDGISTDNIRFTTIGTNLLNSNRTINSLAMVVAGATTLDLGGNTLAVVSGGVIASNSTNDTAITITNGTLTAGVLNVGGDLYLHTFGYINGDTNTINRDVNIDAIITNNGTGAVTVVINGDDGRGTGLDGLLNAESTNITGNNTYTGGTFINAGRVILNNSTANGTTVTATGTGDLTIAGGASTLGNTYQEFRSSVIYGAANQIANTATVNLIGSGRFNLNGFNQTIANLVINNTGGHNPEVTTGVGTLTISGSSITASGQNASSNAISTIAGKLAFGAATTTITVNPVEWNSEVLNPILPNLLISASIEGNNIIKAGTGVLSLTGANAFTGTFDLQAGGLQLGNNNALSTGTLTIGNNTFLTSTADNRALTNAYTVSGNFALRDAFNLTLSGAGTLAAGNHDIGVDLTQKSLTLSGVLSGATANINKVGDGILVLGNSNNTYGGITTVSDGILRYGAVNAVPTGSAVSVMEGALLDITTGGTAVTVGSLASNNAAQGGVVFHGATSGTNDFTAGGDNTTTSFGGVIANATGSTLNFVKTGTGTMTVGGANAYNGSTTVANGRLIAQPVSGNSPLGTSQSLIMGGATTAGILQLGNGTGALNHTFTSLASGGSATTNQIVSGNATQATLTLNLASNSVFAGNIGGGGANEANLNLIKDGAGDLTISGTGTSLYNGTTLVSGGKLFMNTAGAFPTVTTSLTLADSTEFSLRGTTLNTLNSYNFGASAGAKIVVGSATGATLGFGLDGTGNTQLLLASGQTMNLTGTLTTAIYVNSAPTSGQKYVLIDGFDLNSLTGFGGTFNLSPVVFNGGSFTYALSFDSGVNGGGLEQWVITPTAVAAQPDVWWKGDLTGLAAGVWSATLSSGTGFPSNWDDSQSGGVDAVVPPDMNSIVHFSATGAANFATTLGANMTIKALVFEAGNAATTIGSSNGINTLTLGNGVDTPSLSIFSTAGDVGISAVVALPQNQSWNIEDTARVLTLSGGLTGASRTLTVNDTTTNSGTLLFSGSAASMTGTLNQNAGVLAFEGTGSLNSGLNVALGTATKAATLKVGNTTAATTAIIGGLSNGSFAGSRVIGGNATISTLTIGSTSGSHTFSGDIGGVGANENNFNLVKDGAGIQILNGTVNTWSGTTIVREGTLRLGAAAVFAPTGTLSVIANAGTTAIMDFNGKNFTTTGVLTLGGGASGVAQVIGASSTLTLGGNIVYDAAGNPGNATISANLIGTGANRIVTVGDSTNSTNELTISGTYTSTSDNSLQILGAGNGTISGNVSISPTGGVTSTRDFVFDSTGTWNINAKIEVGDDILINSGVINATVGESLDATDDVVIDGTGTQGSAIVNISSTSQVHTGDDIFIRNGGQINIIGAGGIGTGTDVLLIGDSASASAAAAGLLNYTANVNISTTTGLQLGAAGGQIGNITGTGTFTSAGTKDLRNGSIDSGITLAGNGAITKQAIGTVTFSGARAGASTGATNIFEGTLILDYSTNNSSKIGGVLNLGQLTNVSNATLQLNGNSGASTNQSVTSTTIAAGSTKVIVNNGTGQTAALNLGAITRTATGRGVVSLEYLSSSAKATSTSPAGTLGYATLAIGGGVERFAAIDGAGDIVQAALTTQNAVGSWAAGQNIINSAAFSGAVDCKNIASLTFDGIGAANTLSLTSTGHLIITSGGILVDSTVGAFAVTISGGSLIGASNSGIAGEIIVHQNNTLSTLTIASKIINSGGITKTGLGTLILTGANTFLNTGSQLTINEGTVQLGGGNAIGDTTSVYMRQGTTLNLNNSNEVVGHLVNESNGTIAMGTGDITFNQTGNSSYRGVFTGVAGGLITVNSAGFNFNVTGSTTTGYAGTVVVNSGLFQLSGSAGRLSSATSFTINKGATFLIDNNDDSAPNDRISDSAAFILNSADGAFSTETRPRGLALRSDNNGNESETIGALTFNSGASYATLEASGGTSSRNDIISSGWTRSNSATINVRGRTLGDTGTNNATQFKVLDANDATMVAANVGGGGTIGGTAKNVSIVPWAIGENLTAALADTNMGNTFLSYVDNRGFVPLNLTNEFSTFATAGGATDNVRENLTADLTGLSTQTVNSLIINRNIAGAGTTNVTGTGVGGQILINTSGAFLFTLTGATNSTAHTIILDGFDGGIQVGATNEYVIHVVNPSSATTTATVTARVKSALNTTAASVTKSGRGTLEFTAVNTYAGGTTVNEGTLIIHANDNIGGTGGGTQGDITLAGGLLSLASDYADDLGSRDLLVREGGGTIQVDAAAVTATNLITTGTGSLVKTGTGTLQVAGGTANTHTGVVAVNEGALELNKTAGVNAISGSDLTIGGAGLNATVTLLASNQIVNTTAVSITTTGATAMGALDLNSNSDAIGSLTMTSSHVQGALVTTGASGTLTVGGNITLNSNRSGNDASTNARNVVITGTGTIGTAAPNTGTLNLGGATRIITVQTSVTGATLGNADATIESAITNGGVIKEGSRALILSGTNTYTGGTTINNGELNLRDGSLAAGAVIVNKEGGSLSNAAVLSGTGTIAGAVSIGEADCGVGILAPGTISSTTTLVSNYGADGNGTLTLSAAGTALTVADGSQIQMGITNATYLSAGLVNDLMTNTYTTALAYIGANGAEFTANWNVAPASSTDLDYINATGAGSNISIGDRAGAAFGQGSIRVAALGAFTPAFGQVLNLLDWVQAINIGGNFDTGASVSYDATSNVIAGDLDLPSLGAGFAWDVSAFQQYGLVVIVPEPSRLMLLFFGLFGLCFRRRRIVSCD